MRSLVLLWLGAVALQAAPPASLGVSPLIQSFRSYVAEVEQIKDPFGAGLQALAGASLVDMAKVDFIVAASRPIHPRYVHDDDRKFILSAVRGQPRDELETHLPAAMNYVRLATAAPIYYGQIRRQELMWGEPRGLETLESIARRTDRFRRDNVAEILDRRMRPSRVLTAANLGEFGDPALLAQLEDAYRDGRDQFHSQRNVVVLLVFLFQLGLSFAVAVFFLQKRPAEVRIKL